MFKKLLSMEMQVKLLRTKFSLKSGLRTAEKKAGFVAIESAPPVRSGSRQITLPVQTASYWLVPISSYVTGMCTGRGIGYLSGHLSYVNSSLWVMVQHLLPPLWYLRRRWQSDFCSLIMSSWRWDVVYRDSSLQEDSRMLIYSQYHQQWSVIMSIKEEQVALFWH